MTHTLIFLITFIVTGSLGGFCAGFFGLGGGILYIPIFISLFAAFNPTGQSNMHAAIGTSLALIIPGALIAAMKQFKLGNIDRKIARLWTAMIIAGAIVGSILIRYISSYVLQIVFMVFLLLAILITLHKTNSSQQRENLNKKILSSFAIFTGFCAVLMGVGGGIITVPLLKLLNYPYKRAVALSAVGGTAVGIFGSLIMIYTGWHATDLPAFSIGFVNWLAFICIVPLSLIFAPLGVRASNHINEKLASYLYSLVLFIIAVYMACRVFYH
ncbi:MAG: hypothetical protein A3E87_03550 [Gammaproteobacteria bacterium RIFCSPHIGHO2_12_FULL_35_23]|nr:MAG: hypothetical protein A3E87_03550 [Gammaproteobacteria bacterium RIFCSPHIGHO2_12_FULL_35_23]